MSYIYIFVQYMCVLDIYMYIEIFRDAILLELVSISENC